MLLALPRPEKPSWMVRLSVKERPIEGRAVVEEPSEPELPLDEVEPCRCIDSRKPSAVMSPSVI